LEFFDGFGPVEFVKAVQKPLREFCDAEHPLPHGFSDDGVSAAFADASDDFFVG